MPLLVLYVYRTAAMGSVGDDYKCPCCGRVGNGGYALDGINFPICTGGEHSCLWFHVLASQKLPTYIVGGAIQRLFAPSITLPPNVAWKVADALKGWD